MGSQWKSSSDSSVSMAIAEAVVGWKEENRERTHLHTISYTLAWKVEGGKNLGRWRLTLGVCVWVCPCVYLCVYATAIFRFVCLSVRVSTSLSVCISTVSAMCNEMTAPRPFARTTKQPVSRSGLLSPSLFALWPPSPLPLSLRPSEQQWRPKSGGNGRSLQLLLQQKQQH